MTGGTFIWLVLQDVKRLLLARWMAGATILLCACSAFSVVLSTHKFQEHHETYDGLIQQRVEVQLRGSGRVLGRSAEPGLRVIREPAPGSVFAAGIEPTLPASWEFTPAGTEALDSYPRQEVDVNDRGVGDLAGIIGGLGGLLALWLGVSTVVSDRIAGRVAAVRTLPVAPQTMAVVRLAGGTAASTVLAAMWCLTVVVTVRVFVPADLDISPLMPVWMAGPVVSYLVLMFALGTGVGAAVREGVSALVTTFLLWLVIMFVVPQTNQLVTRSLIDVSPRSRMETERRDHMADEALLLEQQIGNAMATQWPDVPLPTNEQQSVAYFSVGEPVWSAGLTRIREAASREEHQWIEQRTRADRVKAWLDALNPNSWLTESMAELAGTGRSSATDWIQAVALHDQALNEKLFADRPRVNARALWKGQGIVMAFDRRPAPRYSDLPPFVPPPSHSATWTSAALRNFAGLAAYTLLVVAAAYVALRALLR